jgi:hypothetical protein
MIDSISNQIGFVHKLENCPDFFYLQYPMDVYKDLEGENGATVTWNHVNGEFQ